IGLGLWLPNGRPSPFWGRAGDILDLLLIVALTPLALGVLDLYAWVRGLAGGRGRRGGRGGGATGKPVRSAGGGRKPAVIRAKLGRSRTRRLSITPSLAAAAAAPAACPAATIAPASVPRSSRRMQSGVMDSSTSEP